MLNIRGWTGSATVSALQARAASAGHDFSEALLIKVSAISSAFPSSLQIQADSPALSNVKYTSGQVQAGLQVWVYAAIGPICMYQLKMLAAHDLNRCEFVHVLNAAGAGKNYRGAKHSTRPGASLLQRRGCQVL